MPNAPAPAIGTARPCVADTILSMEKRTEVQRKQYRLQHVKQIAHYDIKESAKLVENIYECKLLKKK